MQFLVAIHHPDDYDPAMAENDAMRHEIDELNDEMVAAGVRVFVGGLKPATLARSVRLVDGDLVMNEGPYLPNEEHVGGFWVLDVRDMEAALEWGRKAAVACRAPVEVRPFH